MRRRRLVTSCILAASINQCAWAQTLINGAWAMQSNSTGTTLSSNGYVGTYIVIPAGGATVNFSISAAASAINSGTPHMQLTVADTTASFNVSSTSATTYTTPDIFLPNNSAGTVMYAVNDQRDYSGNINVTKSFTVGSMSVNTVGGTGTATFSNPNINDGTTLNANSLNAANAYIANFRQGTAAVAVTGPGGVPLLGGISLHTHMARNAFNFGGTVSGNSLNDSKDMLGSNNTGSTSEAAQFQTFINNYFNTIVPSNGGKWANNEGVQNSVSMGLVDEQINYAKAHNMSMRMHNLIWGSGAMGGSQQPTWVTSLITSAAGGNGTAKNNLSTGITNRINYYVGGTNGGNAERASNYIEMDVLNEALHNPSYWNIYGGSLSSSNGVAGIYNQVTTAAGQAGNPNMRLYTNEYNVLQFSPNAINSSGTESGSDSYANWYRNEVEGVRNGGGAVSGIGVQMYADVNHANQSGSPTDNNIVSTANMAKAYQDLSVEGLPISMAEFGLANATNNQSLGPAALENAVRMTYGTPNATTFMVWGWWDTSGNTPPLQMLVTTPGASSAVGSLNLTALGQKWVSLMNAFSTADSTLTVDSSGHISLSGFYGNYNIGSQTANSDLTFAKSGVNTASLIAPPNWSLWNTANNGSWTTAGNWSTGGIANAAGQTAYFGPTSASRNVTVNSAQGLGMIALDSGSLAGSYTIGGAGTITLQGFNNASGHVAAIYVAAGSHQIDAPLVMADNTTITIAPVNSTLTLSHFQSSMAALTKSGSGTLAVNTLQTGGVQINAGTLKLLSVASGGTASAVNSLGIAGGSGNWSATLNTTDQSIVVNYTAGSPIGTIQNMLKSGYANGSWNGTGINSSSAAATALGPVKTAIGFGEAAVLGLGSNAVVLEYAMFGDANLDGAVNALDFNAVAASYGSVTSTWISGDFNYDGVVDTTDFALMAGNFGQQLPVSAPNLGALVPEPASLGLLGFTAAGLLKRRRQFCSMVSRT